MVVPCPSSLPAHFHLALFISELLGASFVAALWLCMTTGRLEDLLEDDLLDEEDCDSRSRREEG